jgi:sugar/nucleoside kinase (ribokinase family)
MPLCIAAARAARERNVPVVMDSGSWKRGMSQLLPFVDIAICSADFRPPKCRDIRDVFDYLRDRGIRRIAITRGASPLSYEEDGQQGTISVARIRPKDTLGAGDVFHGAFCYYACQPDTTFRDALVKAGRVATFSCRFSGTRSWMKAWKPISR